MFRKKVKTKKSNCEELRKLLLYRKIVEWDKSSITLDNGVKLTIDMTDNDCCAWAGGQFKEVKLDAAITKVSEIEYNSWEDDGTYGCSATVTILHNQNIICKANADADAGNGGYYYSIASFVVTYPNGNYENIHFVGSDD